MAAQSLVIACTSTPTIVGGSGIHGYIRVRLKMIAGTGYLGDSGVTTAGSPLTTGDGPTLIELLTGESLWIASSSGASASVAVLRLNETS